MASIIQGKSAWVSGELAFKTGCCLLVVVCLRGLLVPLLVDVADFLYFLYEQVWVAKTDESCLAWVDLPRVAVVLPHPCIFVLGIRSFF